MTNFDQYPFFTKQNRPAADLLGVKIQTERQARGWTRDKLAETVGVTRTAVVLWESGRNRPIEANILKLERALGVDLVGRHDKTIEAAPQLPGWTWTDRAWDMACGGGIVTGLLVVANFL